jgi:hypothetical protein
MGGLLGVLEDRRTICMMPVVGWALYISVVTLSNLSCLLQSFGWFDWAFNSGNLDYIHTATEIYFDSKPIDQFLLAGVIVWEGTAALLLWRGALRLLHRRPDGVAAATGGLALLGFLWFMFAVFTEVFVAFARGVDEPAYFTMAAVILASIIVLHLLRPGAAVDAA